VIIPEGAKLGVSKVAPLCSKSYVIVKVYHSDFRQVDKVSTQINYACKDTGSGEQTSMQQPSKNQSIPINQAEQALRRVYWAKQVFALVFGFLWGIFGFTGAPALIGFVHCELELTPFRYGILSLIFPVVASKLIFHVDEEELGGFSSLIQDGLMTQLSMFLVGVNCSACGITNSLAGYMDHKLFARSLVTAFRQ